MEDKTFPPIIPLQPEKNFYEFFGNSFTWLI